MLNAGKLPTQDSEKLGFAIRVLRETKGLTLRDVAEKCDVGTSYVSQVERFEKQPSKGFLDALAPVLGVSRQLFYEIPLPSTPARRALQERRLKESLDRIESTLHEIKKIITEKKAEQNKSQPAKA